MPNQAWMFIEDSNWQTFCIEIDSAAFNPYPPGLKPGTDLYGFTGAQLIRAAIMVGKNPQWQVEVGSTFAQKEIEWRTSMLQANIVVSGNRLRFSKCHSLLDRTEKAAFSYFLGMTCTYLLGEHFLNIPYLLHLDRYYADASCAIEKAPVLVEQEDGSFKEKNLSPDLFGWSHQPQWYVMEAKGHSGGPGSGTLKGAKDQTRAVKSVQGEENLTRVAVNCFRRQNALAIQWCDPPGGDDGGLEMRFDEEQFLNRYYEVVAKAVSESETLKDVQGLTCRVIYLPSVDISVGLDQEVLAAYRAGELHKYFGQTADALVSEEPLALSLKRRSVSQVEDNFSYLGLDGVYVQLGKSWQKEKSNGASQGKPPLCDEQDVKGVKAEEERRAFVARPAPPAEPIELTWGDGS